LALFVSGVALTDDPNDTSPSDELAMLAHPLYARSNLHFFYLSGFSWLAI
jgi:hypothetical protein